jgi:hypothetical protein
MAIYFVHETGRVDIEDIPLDDFAKIQEQTGVEWWRVITSPLDNARAAQMLVEAASRVLGVPIPEKLTPKTLVGMIEVDNGKANVSEVFEEGIPDPKAEVEPETI